MNPLVRIAALAAACLAAGRPASGQVILEHRDVAVTALHDHHASGTTLSGYAEFRFLVHNRGARERAVELILEGDASGGALTLSRSAALPGGARKEFALYQPCLACRNLRIRLRVDGREAPDVRQAGGLGHGLWNGYFHEQADGDGLTVLAAKGIDLGESAHFQSGRPPSAWPEEWLALGRFSGVAMTSAHYQAMPEPARLALRRYVACGGVLFLAEAEAVPQELRGSGHMDFSYIGMGLCLARRKVASPQAMTLLYERCSFLDEERPDIDLKFPVIDADATPLRGLVIAAVFFALALGPGALWLTGRLKRRIWMLWIVPCVSLVFCAILLFYSLLAEGWNPRLRVAALTVLDENARMAATVARLGYYCPLTPGSGLRFDAQTELTPAMHRSDDAWTARSRAVEFGQGQRWSSTWVAARTTAHFRVRKAQACRLRLELDKAPDGTIRAVNGLGARILELRLADAEGRIWSAGRIPAGETATLERTAGTCHGTPEAPRSLYRGDWSEAPSAALEAPAKLLQPGTYLAWLSDDPFLEPGLQKIGERRVEALVYGFSRREPDAD